MAAVISEEGDFPKTDAEETRTRILTDWSVDRLIARLEGWFQTFKAHMEEWTDQRPPPDFEKDRRELTDLLIAAVQAGAQQARVEINSQHSEGGGGEGNGSKSWREKLIFPLVVAGVIGIGATFVQNWMQGVAMQQKIDDYIAYDQKRHEEQRQDADRRLDRLERKVFP